MTLGSLASGERIISRTNKFGNVLVCRALFSLSPFDSPILGLTMMCVMCLCVYTCICAFVGVLSAFVGVCSVRILAQIRRKSSPIDKFGKFKKKFGTFKVRICTRHMYTCKSTRTHPITSHAVNTHIHTAHLWLASGRPRRPCVVR